MAYSERERKFTSANKFIWFPNVNIWNSLPDYVVEADSLKVFKNRLDKYWTNQDVDYLLTYYKLDLT